MTAPGPDLAGWCRQRAENFAEYERVEMAMYPSGADRDTALVEWTLRVLGNPELAESREVLAILAERHGAGLEKYGNELRDRRTEDLNLRGLLSPNGYPSPVPMELGPSLVPAVEWLIAEVERLTGRADVARRFAQRYAEPHALVPIEMTHLAGRVLAALDGRDYDNDPVLPERTAVPGEPLPPVPDSAYPPGATPLDEAIEADLRMVAETTGVSYEDVRELYDSTGTRTADAPGGDR